MLSLWPVITTNRGRKTMSYEEIYTRSMGDPEGFWAEAAADIDWIKPWDKVLDDSNKPFYRWFTGGELNTCYNAVAVRSIVGQLRASDLVWEKAELREAPPDVAEAALPGLAARWLVRKGFELQLSKGEPCWQGEEQDPQHCHG